MRIVLEPSSEFIEISVAGVSIPARIWRGHTVTGIPCHAFITHIAVNRAIDCEQFSKELLECQVIVAGGETKQ